MSVVPFRCNGIYALTYNAYIASGYSPDDASSAAASALQGCIERSASFTPVATPVVVTQAGRLSEAPDRRESQRSTNIGRSSPQIAPRNKQPKY
jgi:hypothetical protein